jgi:hypothetical protein
MDQSSTLLGSNLLAELRSSDGMTVREGEDWISRMAGRSYDAGAMYLLTLPEHEDPKTWGGYAGLRLHVMSDSELIVLEREYRKREGLPPRRPWEPHMFESAMGRSERP